ncbi:MAG: hypothetical protein AB7G44_06790 [Bacteroidia bacterium]
MNNHIAYTFHFLEQVSPNVWNFFAVTKNGVALGTCINSLKYYKMNTFISHDMLKGDQLQTEAFKKSRIR